MHAGRLQEDPQRFLFAAAAAVNLISHMRDEMRGWYIYIEVCIVYMFATRVYDFSACNNTK